MAKQKYEQQRYRDPNMQAIFDRQSRTPDYSDSDRILAEGAQRRAANPTGQPSPWGAPAMSAVLPQPAPQAQRPTDLPGAYTVAPNPAATGPASPYPPPMPQTPPTAGGTILRPGVGSTGRGPASPYPPPAGAAPMRPPSGPMAPPQGAMGGVAARPADRADDPALRAAARILGTRSEQQTRVRMQRLSTSANTADKRQLARINEAVRQEQGNAERLASIAERQKREDAQQERAYKQEREVAGIKAAPGLESAAVRRESLDVQRESIAQREATARARIEETARANNMRYNPSDPANAETFRRKLEADAERAAAAGDTKQQLAIMQAQLQMERDARRASSTGLLYEVGDAAQTELDQRAQAASVGQQQVSNAILTGTLPNGRKLTPEEIEDLRVLYAQGQGQGARGAG